LMNQTSGEELTALVVEAQNIKRQLSDLARLQPSVAEGIAGIGQGVRTEAPEIMAAQIKRATAPEAKIFEPGTGREELPSYPIGRVDPEVIAGITDKNKFIQASMRMSDKHRKQLREMWKKRMGQAAGGRIGFRRGTSGAPGGGDPGMTSDPSGAGQTHGGEGPQGPINRHAGPTTKQALITGQKKKDLRDLLAQQQAEKDYTRTGQIKPGPQRGLGFAGSGGVNLGSMASQFAGSKIGGGLGSMLLGPWGMLLGSLFGRGVGRRGWQASQTEEKESLKDILFGSDNVLSSLLNKKKTPTVGGEGIQTIDIRDKFNRLGDDTYSSIDETIDDYNYDPRVRSLPQRKKFDMKDVSTWYDTHPATGESVMTPGFKERYQGSDKLNPRYIADSYEYMDQSRPEWGTAEATQRPHTFGQEHEWDFFGNPNIKEDDFPSDEEIFKRRFG